MHHIFPGDSGKYVKNVCNILKPGAKYLSVCFSEKDPQFDGMGKYRKTPIETILYFYPESEIHDLFSPYFDIRELKTIEIKIKYVSHYAIYISSERRRVLKKSCISET